MNKQLNKIVYLQILRIPKWSSAKFFLSLCVISFMLFANACKEAETAGLEVQPKQDKFALTVNTDTKVLARSVYESSLRSDETTQALLGSYYDPEFGKHSAAFLTQLLLSENQPDFGSGAVLDSVILNLAIKKHYGDVSETTGKQRFKVYAMNADISKDAAYYSSTLPSNYYTESDLLADTTLLPNPLSSIITSDGSVIPASLRIRLNKNKFAHFLSSDYSGYFVSNATFISLLKGLSLVTQTSGQVSGAGAILYLDLLNTYSKMTFYFHNSSSSSKSFNFIINSSCARINTFTHDYSPAPKITEQMNENLSDFESSYLQSMAGLKIKLTMPFLQSWRDSLPMAISKAEIVFTAAPGSLDTYYSPVKLQLVAIDSLGANLLMDDNILEDENYFGGFFTSSTSSYTFNITRHFQQVLDGKRKDYGYYLQCIGGTNTADRLILQSGSGIKLKLTYTKL